MSCSVGVIDLLVLVSFWICYMGNLAARIVAELASGVVCFRSLTDFAYNAGGKLEDMSIIKFAGVPLFRHVCIYAPLRNKRIS